MRSTVAGAAAHDAPSSVGPKAGLPVDEILSSIEAVAYRWNVQSDEMEWSADAEKRLGVSGSDAIRSGTAFQLLIAPEHVTRRRESLLAPLTEGQLDTYQSRFRFTASGRRGAAACWAEETGRRQRGPDGRVVAVSGILRIIGEDERSQRAGIDLRDYDELSGQLNRGRLSEALQTTIARCIANRRTAAFLMVSISNLASINETFGFDVGDELIARVAERLRGRLRSADTLGRHSSSRFGVILNDCHPNTIGVAAQRLIDAVRRETINTTSGELPCSVTIGGVQIPAHAKTEQQAVAYALEALSKAKTKRANSFVIYEPSRRLDANRHRAHEMADKIVVAVHENRMHLALQPIVCAKTHKLAFHECLLRLEQPDGTMASAGEFIALAERLGLGGLVDRRALELAIGLLRENPALNLALNVSSLSTSDHEWLVTLHALTGGRREIIQRLSVEITETAAIEDLDQTMSFVDALKEMGCSVAIDDFGAGFTSFRNLKYLNIDMVKIDGSFVRNMLRDASDRAFVETLASLARSFNAKTVAEWVGDAETAQALSDMGIDYLQGFYFGEPQIASTPLALRRRAAG
jgi:diguanylate cyclase (GGDEF)-like protein